MKHTPIGIYACVIVWLLLVRCGASPSLFPRKPFPRWDSSRVECVDQQQESTCTPALDLNICEHFCCQYRLTWPTSRQLWCGARYGCVTFVTLGALLKEWYGDFFSLTDFSWFFADLACFDISRTSTAPTVFHWFLSTYIWGPPTSKRSTGTPSSARCGAVDPRIGCQSRAHHDAIPREIRSHQWSLLKVPLMWVAAIGDQNCPVLTWLSSAARNVSVLVREVQFEDPAAVYAGWDAMHSTMKSWRIQSREDLAEWIFHQGFHLPRWSGHFSGREKERILNAAVASDGRVASLEASYIQITLSMCDRDPDIASRQVGCDNPQVPTPEPERVPASGWEVLYGVDLTAVCQTRSAVIQNCPFQFKGRFRQAARQALEARQEAVLSHDIEMESRAWKLFCLLPYMLLRRPCSQGGVGKAELCHRFDKFGSGDCQGLLDDAQRSVAHEARVERTPTEDSQERRAEAACQKVKLGEVSRARQCLTRAALAPRTDTTFHTLQNRRPQAAIRVLPEEVLRFEPDTPVDLSKKIFLNSLRSAPKGALPGLGGCTYEHQKSLVEEMDLMELLFADVCERHRERQQGSSFTKGKRSGTRVAGLQRMCTRWGPTLGNQRESKFSALRSAQLS